MATVTKPAAAPVAQLYALTAKGNAANLSSGTKWPLPVATNTNATGNTGGNAATLAAVAKLGATFTLAQYQQACAARNHKGFAAYGIRNGWVAPVATK
jgi:hypothetical protein